MGKEKLTPSAPWGQGEHVPAFPFGNERDARIIAESSRRPIEEFLRPARLAVKSSIEGEAADAKDNKKEN